MSRLPFSRQPFKKRGNVAGNLGDSTFETDEKTTKIPDINKIMERIDNTLNKTKDID
jgi:hypothetical protein